MLTTAPPTPATGSYKLLGHKNQKSANLTYSNHINILNISRLLKLVMRILKMDTMMVVLFISLPQKTRSCVALAVVIMKNASFGYGDREIKNVISKRRTIWPFIRIQPIGLQRKVFICYLNFAR